METCIFEGSAMQKNSKTDLYDFANYFFVVPLINLCYCISSSKIVLWWCNYWPKREEDGSWRKLHNDELHSLYSSPNIVRMIKSRRTRWAGHVARMGRGGLFREFWLGGPKARDHWEDLDVGGRIALSWALWWWVSMGRTGFSWLRIGTGGGFLWTR
jgi:hypothetical protein